MVEGLVKYIPAIAKHAHTYSESSRGVIVTVVGDGDPSSNPA